MYKFCIDKNEIASIIGHEISHNELGHIKQNISKAKTYDYYFGKEYGELTLFISNLLNLFNKAELSNYLSLFYAYFYAKT